MDVCKCCKLAHKNLVFSQLPSFEAENEDYLPQAVLDDLGDTSLSWFEDLTESFLSTNSSREKDGSNSLSDFDKTWSPCPRGGVAIAKVKDKAVSEAAHLCSSKMVLEHSTNNTNRSSSCEDLCTSNADLSWTSAMATPMDTAGTISHFSGDNTLSSVTQDSFSVSAKKDTPTSSVTTHDLTEKENAAVKTKVLSRMLFSPGQKSLSSDSLLGTVEWSLEDDETIELEETICSESDVMNNTSIKLNRDCADKALEDEQDTLTAQDSIESSNINLDNCIDSSIICAEGKSHKKKIVSDCKSGDKDFKSSDVGTIGDSEFSDSFTAEEMEMIEDDCVKQPEKLQDTKLQFGKVDSALPLSVPPQPATAVSGKLTKQNVRDYDRYHPHVDSVLSMIFPSQSIDPASNLELANDEMKTKVHKEEPAEVLSTRHTETLKHKETQNEAKPALIPPSDVNWCMKKEEMTNIKETATPQSILKRFQTPKSSAKKRVRFSIEADPSQLSQLQHDSLTDLTKRDVDFSDVVSDPEKTVSDSQELIAPSAINSKLQNQHLTESMPDDSQSQCELVSSQVEDISSLYYQGNNIVLSPDGFDIPSQIIHNWDQPFSTGVNGTRKAEEIYSLDKELTISTPFNVNTFQDEFVFDDLSPPLSPAFHSQVLYQAEKSGNEIKCKTETEMSMADVKTSQMTVSNVLSVPSNESLLGTVSTTDTTTQDQNKCEKDSCDVNGKSLIEAKAKVNENTAVMLEDDDDDDIMCAAAMNAEKSSKKTCKESSVPAMEKETFHITQQTYTDKIVGNSDLSSSLLVLKIPGETNLVGESPEVKVSTETSSTTPSLTTSMQPTLSNSFKVVTPFTKPKIKKFLYPASVQKQPTELKESDKSISFSSTANKEQQSCAEPTSTIHDLSLKSTRAAQTSSGDKSKEAHAPSGPFLTEASQSASSSSNNINKPDSMLWKTALDKNNGDSKAFDTPVGSGIKSNGKFLGFAKFSDVFQDTDEPLNPLPSPKATTETSENSDKISEIQKEDKIIDKEKEHDDALNLETTDLIEKVENCYPVSHEMVNGNMKDGKHSNKETKDLAAVAETHKEQIDQADETHISGSLNFDEDFEEGFTSQMWRASEFSQMEGDAEGNRKQEDFSVVTIEAGVSLDGYNASSDTELMANLTDSVPNNCDNIKTQKLSSGGDSAKFFVGASKHKGAKLPGGFTSAASLSKNPPEPSNNFEALSCFEVDLENQLENMIKARKISANVEERAATNQKLQFNRGSMRAKSFTLDQAEAEKMDVLEDQLEQVLQKRKTVNSKTTKKSFNLPIASTSGSFVVANATDQDEKRLIKNLESHKEYGSKDVSKAVIAPLSGKLQKGGFTTASGKDMTLSDAAQHKAQRLWESVAMEVEDLSSGNANNEGAIDTVNFDNRDLGHKRLQTVTAPACGFATAGGKAISMSIAAETKAKKLWESVQKDMEDQNGNQIDDSLSLCGSLFNAAQAKDNQDKAFELHGRELKFSEEDMTREQEGNKQNVTSFDKRHKGFQPFKAPKILKNSCALAAASLGQTNKNVSNASVKSNDEFPTKNKTEEAFAEKNVVDIVSTDAKGSKGLAHLMIKEAEDSSIDMTSKTKRMDENFQDKFSLATCACHSTQITFKSEGKVAPQISKCPEVSNARQVLGDQIPVEAAPMGKDPVFIDSVDFSESNQALSMPTPDGDYKNNNFDTNDFASRTVGIPKVDAEYAQSKQHMSQGNCQQNALDNSTAISLQTCKDTSCSNAYLSEKSHAAKQTDAEDNSVLNCNKSNTSSCDLFPSVLENNVQSDMNMKRNEDCKEHDMFLNQTSLLYNSEISFQTLETNEGNCLNDDVGKKIETCGNISATEEEKKVNNQTDTDSLTLPAAEINLENALCQTDLNRNKCGVNVGETKSTSTPFGFTAASGKPVNVLEKSMNSAKVLITGSDQENSARKEMRTSVSEENTNEVSTLLCKAMCSPDKAVCKAVSLSNCEVNFDKLDPMPLLIGFSTASGKSLRVSEKALCQAESFLDDDDDQSSSISGMFKSHSSGFSTASGKKVSVSEKALSHAKTFLDEVPESLSAKESDMHKPSTFGFSTASGKSVSVSEKALLHAKTSLDDNLQSLSEPDMRGPSLSEFSASSGKSKYVAKTALCQTKSSLHKDHQSCSENLQGPVINKPSSSGFSTASGKTVTVSEKALIHAKTFLDDEPQNLSLTPTEFDTSKPSTSRFTTASGKAVTVSEKALIHAKTFLDDEPQNLSAAPTEFDTSKPSTSRFTTASGKAVTVSEKALIHAKTFLDETSQGFSEEQEKPKMPKPCSSGFSTASGKSVSISEKALLHAKTFLEDDVKEDCNNRTLSSHSGFSTASGQAVTDKSLSTANSLLDTNATVSCDTSEKKKTPKPFLPGFSTAGGSSVSVSAKALHHAKNLLSDSSEYSSLERSDGIITKAKISPCTVEELGATDTSVSLDQTIYQNLAPKTIIGGNRCGQSMDDAHLKNDKDMSKDALSDRTILLSRRNLRPKIAKCDEIQYDRSTPKLRKLGTLIFVQHVKEKSRNAPPNANENEALTSSFKPPYKKAKPDASGDFSLPLQGQDQSLNISGKSSFVPPPKVKSSTQAHLGQGDIMNFKNSDHKARPVFGPLKSTGQDSKSFQCESGEIDNNSTSRLTSGASVLTEGKSIELDMISIESMKCADLENEAENQLLCSDFTEVYKNDSGEENAGDSIQSKDLDTKPNWKNKESKPDDLKSSILECNPKSNTQLSRELIASNLKNSYVLEPGSSSNFNMAPQARGKKTSQDSSTATRTCTSIIGSGAPCGIGGGKSIIGAEHAASSTTVQASAIPDLQFEEALMAQEKLIRSKKRRKVQPCCGRWLDVRKKGGLDGKPLRPLSSLAPEQKQNFTHHELLSIGVCPSTLAVNSLNAKDYRFNLRRFFPSGSSRILVGDGALLVPDRQGFAGALEFYKAFLTVSGVDPSLCDQAWVRNHYRWLVWKLAAYEICYPLQFAGRCLTPDLLMLQLKYRYDREVDACHRSAIKKIVERDDTPCKRMVLCVAAVKTQAASAQPLLEVTDGWYSVQAQIDSALADLVSSGRIQPGVKLVTTGAELVGTHGACSPLEIPESLMLKLSGNSTRPARWHARLGYCAPSGPMCVPLVSLNHKGGTVGCVDVVLCRKYPTMYMEKLADGACIFRTLEEEEKVNRKHEEKRQEQIEKLCSSLQAAGEKEMCAKGAVRPKRLNKREIEKLWSGQELAEAMESALNPEDFQQCLSASQLERLSEFKRAEVDRRQQEIQLKLQEAMSDAGHVPRNIVPVKKFRVQGCCRADIDSKSSCTVTVWRPGSDWVDMVEGRRYRLYSMAVGPTRNKSSRKDDLSKHVTLTATRQSRLQEKRISDNLLDLVYEKREAWTVADLKNSHPKGDEFDFVGLLVKVKEADKLSQPIVLYICDTETEMLAVNIWPGRQSLVASSLWPGKVLCMSSLFLRRAMTRERPQSPGSVFTADTRPDFTTFSMSAHTCCYTSRFSQMELLAKNPAFLSEAQKILDNALLQSQVHTTNSSKQHTEIQQYAKPEHLKFENIDDDFPPDVIEQIFNKMSQGSFTESVQQSSPQERLNNDFADLKSFSDSETKPGLSRETELTSNAISSSSVFESCSTPQCPARKRPFSETIKINCSGSINSSANPETSDVDDGSEILKKRKLMLRQKMSKLLAYESPSPLSPLPTELSPASRKAFKTPSMKPKL